MLYLSFDKFCQKVLTIISSFVISSTSSKLFMTLSAALAQYIQKCNPIRHSVRCNLPTMTLANRPDAGERRIRDGSRQGEALVFTVSCGRDNADNTTHFRVTCKYNCNRFECRANCPSETVNFMDPVSFLCSISLDSRRYKFSFRWKKDVVNEKRVSDEVDEIENACVS